MNPSSVAISLLALMLVGSIFVNASNEEAVKNKQAVTKIQLTQYKTKSDCVRADGNNYWVNGRCVRH